MAITDDDRLGTKWHVNGHILLKCDRCPKNRPSTVWRHGDPIPGMFGYQAHQDDVTPDHQLRNLPDLPARKEPHALWRAARAGDVDAVREAVSAGLSLDARDGLGRTPLVVAVVHGRKRCVDVLLDGGADPETPSGHRSRPLAYAAFRGDAALCARLLGAGADPNKKAADGWTALHVAARA